MKKSTKSKIERMISRLEDYTEFLEILIDEQQEILDVTTNEDKQADLEGIIYNLDNTNQFICDALDYLRETIY